MKSFNKYTLIMKNILCSSIIVVALLFSLGACKKDKPISYGNMDMSAIKKQESKFKDTPITAIDADAKVVLKEGAVIIFKTNTGNYGKLQVVSVEQNQLTFNLKVFNAADGSELASKVSAVITQSNWWDLDTGTASINNESDLDYNNPVNSNSVALLPLAGATFMLYSN